MRLLTFASRNRKELVRDPLTLLFAIGLPLLLLILISALQKSIAVDIFRIEKFAPGMVVFSFSFITLFSGMLIANDRASSFLMRIFSSPLSVSDYIFGYALPLLAAAIVQGVVCFAAAVFYGLSVNLNILFALLILIPIAVLFIGLGLLLGTLFTFKQVSGIASILIQVSAFLGGTWFDLNMVGGTFKAIGYALPFAHAVDATRAALAGQISAVWPHLFWCIGYGAAIFTLAVAAFRRKMRS